MQIGAICFEDLEVTPLEPLPVEKEVAAIAANSFSVSPTDEAVKGKNLLSGAASRRAHFCAETAEEAQAWVRALVVNRQSTLLEDRVELGETKATLSSVSEQLRAMTREAADNKAESARNLAAADAEHATVLQTEAELRAVRTQLSEVRDQLRQSEERVEAAEAERKKLELFTAQHKASREEMQQQLEQLKRDHAKTWAEAERQRAEEAEERGAAAVSSPSTAGGGGKRVVLKTHRGSNGSVEARGSNDLEEQDGGGGGGGGVRFGGVVGGGGGGLKKGGLSSKDRKGSVPTVNFLRAAVSGGGGGNGGGNGSGNGSGSSERGNSERGGGGVSWREEEEQGEGERVSDVDEETAINLLAKTQECSAHFRNFSPSELVTLARTLSVLRYKVDETLMYQGEPATFFAVVLAGSVAPIVNMQTLHDKARGVGELVGELSLFNGGTRQASMVGTADGFLALFLFEELAKLKSSADAQQVAIAKKLNHQLARAALAKEIERTGQTLSEIEEQERLVELRVAQEAQHWEVGGGGGGEGGSGSDGKGKLESLVKHRVQKVGLMGEKLGKKLRKQSKHHIMQIGANLATVAADVSKTAASVGRNRALDAEEIDLPDNILAMPPPTPPDHPHGVWREGLLRKRPPEGQFRLPGQSLPYRHCVLTTDAFSYYSEGHVGEGSSPPKEAGDAGGGGPWGSGGPWGPGGGGGGEVAGAAAGGVGGVGGATEAVGADAKGVITMKRVRGVRLTRSADGPQLEIAVGDSLGDKVKRTFYFLAADDASGYAWRLAIEAASSHEHGRTGPRLSGRFRCKIGLIVE